MDIKVQETYEEARHRAERMNGNYAGQYDPEEYEPLIEHGIVRLGFKGLAQQMLGLRTLYYVADESLHQKW